MKLAIKKGRISTVFMLSCSVFIVFSLITQQIDIAKRKQELQDIKKMVISQELTNKETERYIIEGDNPEYIERLAREKLGLVSPSEKIFRDATGT